MTSGVRVDQLSPNLEERHLKLWEHIQRQVGEEAMPPKDEAKQPSIDERQAMDRWITDALTIARTRPGPKNGNARRLTVAQYRNTLQELLLFDEDVADVLPPDAVSKDGFVNNRVRLPRGPLAMQVEYAGLRNIEKIVFTPLDDRDPLSQRYNAFENRSLRIGVHVGLRRDCGTAMAPVGTPLTVMSESMPMLVLSHSWSGVYMQGMSTIEQAKKRGWVFIAPDFRGPYRRYETAAPAVRPG